MTPKTARSRREIYPEIGLIYTAGLGEELAVFTFAIRTAYSTID